MNRQDLDERIASFLHARSARPRWLPVSPDHRPATIAEGYALQKRLHEAREAAGERRLGYKVGATSKPGQRSFGLDEPVYAGMFACDQAVDLAEALRRPLLAPSLECEIAFRLKSDLDGSKPLSVAEVAAAIGTCHIARELVDNRYGDPMALGVPSLLADDFFHVAFVLGAEKPNWRTLDFKGLDAAIEIDGQVAMGRSADVLDALSSLHWLAGKLAEAGRKLVAGEIVLTGTIVPPTRFTPPASSASLRIAGFQHLTT